MKISKLILLYNTQNESLCTFYKLSSKISFIILDILEASLTVIAIKNLIIKENKKGAAIAILKTVALSCQT